MSDLIDRNLIAGLVDSHGNVHWEDIAELPSEQPEVRTQMSSADCISRQAAIDAINALHDKPNAWLDCAVDAVMALPSAQPERTCETCRYNNRTWDMEPCDSCTTGGEDSHYEPSVQQEPEPTMEEFMYGQDLGSPEDGSL